MTDHPARASDDDLKDTTSGTREVGRLLGVRHAVTGGVRRAGDSLRITAQLVDTTTDEPHSRRATGRARQRVAEFQVPA